ncbi:MAG: DUF58 domain-containing protein [Pirellulales bacterium]|nr:DUF58 domain-containing protein [Pirellulales bacterium]
MSFPLSIRPSPRLIYIAGVLVAFSLLAFFWPPVAWLVPPIILLVAILAANDYRALRRDLDAIVLERRMPSTVGRNRPFSMELWLTNQGTNPWTGEVRDVVPRNMQPQIAIHPLNRVAPRQTLRLNSSYRIAVRGLYELGPVWIRLEGRWGMLEGQRSFSCTAPIDVYPEQYHASGKFSKDDTAEVRLLDLLTRSRQQGVGTEFQSLTEYRQGDDPRRMDWRATARYGRPIVRRFQVEQHRDLMLILDCGRLMGTTLGDATKLDSAVDAALMLGRLALQNGDRCGVGVFDKEVLGYLPPVAGRHAMQAITRSIYHVQSRYQESDFSLMFAALQSRQQKRALVVILSDIVDTQTTHRFRASLASLARRHVVVFAALRSPLLAELLHDPVETLLDGHRKMIAFRILREREQAVHMVRRSGVHVLDVEPSKLTVPLINQFIALRRENVL